MSHAMQGHPRRLDHSGEFCQNMPTGRGNGKQLQYSCLEIPMTEDPGGLQPGGHKEWDMTEAIEQYPFTHYHTNERIELLNCLIKAFSHPTFYN